MADKKEERIEGDLRREQILQVLREQVKPLSGSELAKMMGVSRQVIVQDIALLRAVDKNILSTNKGYLLHDPSMTMMRAKRTIAADHGDDRMQEELYTIVDYGGTILDVVVAHDVYGQLTGDLILKNRKDVDEFLEKIKNSDSLPLKTLTGGRHFHTIEAENEQQLDRIQEELQKRGLADRDIQMM